MWCLNQHTDLVMGLQLITYVLVFVSNHLEAEFASSDNRLCSEAGSSVLECPLGQSTSCEDIYVVHLVEVEDGNVFVEAIKPKHNIILL